MQASASRGAFLIRLTAVFTPIVALSQGQNSDRTVWTGSVVALLGGILITLGGSPDASLQVCGERLLMLMILRPQHEVHRPHWHLHSGPRSAKASAGTCLNSTNV